MAKLHKKMRGQFKNFGLCKAKSAPTLRIIAAQRKEHFQQNNNMLPMPYVFSTCLTSHALLYPAYSASLSFSKIPHTVSGENPRLARRLAIRFLRKTWGSPFNWRSRFFTNSSARGFSSMSRFSHSARAFSNGIPRRCIS